jgi:hypothetical protein
MALGVKWSIDFFNWLGSGRRYLQWFELTGTSAITTPRTRLRRVLGTKAAAVNVRDFASTPAYYQQLVDNLTLPDRLALAPLERTHPGEATAIATLARLAAAAVIKTYCDTRKSAPDAKAMRDQHAKQQACLRARFHVRDDLPPQFATGVFQSKRVYDAVVRFSNAAGSRRSDRKSDGRGMAVKLLLDGTHSANMLSTLAPGEPAAEQDFLMTNNPVFFCKEIADYTKFIQILALPADGLIPKIRSAAAFLLFFIPWRLPQLRIFIIQALRHIDSPLRETYHSMTPYGLGDKVVRYMAVPLQTPQPGAAPQNQSRDDFLHQAVVAELDPATHAAHEKAVFDFRVRVKGDPASDDVEDASAAWDAPGDTTVSLGRIEIPLQSFDGPADICACENFSFNPWHALPEHRPLGSLNRARLAVYFASKQVRHRLNML